MNFRHKTGDEIEFTGTVNQRITETVISGNSKEAIIGAVQEVEKKLKVLDENSADMIFCKFDTDTWHAYREE